MPVVSVEGRRLALSNLDKVIYPDGTTKGELLHYYATHGSVLLPHLAGRPLSLLRYPDGPEGETFFAKNVPPGTPEWVTTAEVPRSGGGTMRQVVINELAALVWAANLVVEFHTPQWLAGDPGMADRLVFDLDPGEPATVVECCEVARWLRDRLAADGLTAYAKTSGGKGLHLLSPLRPTAPAAETSAYAKALAREAAKALSGLAIATMTRRLRPGKVFIDHSQNAARKTTATPYTLRARATPLVSAPVGWDEIEGCASPEQLIFALPDMPARLDAYGDLMRDLSDPRRARPLPAAG
ncbi:non-homologous end-joining DNA ligase [Streptomyces litchfieldiae]|uniref:Non-homologous end-joining DNA ligase n=1 Tax=Streptomyces litchfieldiae TaxID=3075543 RepID=A0ABU2MVG5_9ACTN|nr:non-homologous end-joining DNA ligase [Streptomyces sp. DSM 44938]MDT0345637.1 non-homologous end-joining DNA ligase [Streptomyces sp. DSM 44938]